MLRRAVLALSCCAFAVDIALAAAVPSETAVRRAATTFLDQPTSSVSKHSMKTIMAFASESDKVTVTISRKAVPWYGNERLPHAEVLLCAFIAGNVISQLDSGVNADDSYSGLMKVFRVYRSIKRRKRTYRVPEIERLLALHKAKRLMRFLLPEDDKP